MKLKECFVFKVKLNTTTPISLLFYPQYCTVFSSICCCHTSVGSSSPILIQYEWPAHKWWGCSFWIVRGICTAYKAHWQQVPLIKLANEMQWTQDYYDWKERMKILQAEYYLHALHNNKSMLLWSVVIVTPFTKPWENITTYSKYYMWYSSYSKVKPISCSWEALMSP